MKKPFVLIMLFLIVITSLLSLPPITGAAEQSAVNSFSINSFSTVRLPPLPFDENEGFDKVGVSADDSLSLLKAESVLSTKVAKVLVNYEHKRGKSPQGSDLKEKGAEPLLRLILVLDKAVAEENQTLKREVLPLPGQRKVTLEHPVTSGISGEFGRKLEAMGVKVEAVSGKMVQAEVPISSLRRLSQNERIRYIRYPLRANKEKIDPIFGKIDGENELNTDKAGSVTTEGVALSNVDIWQNAGYQGQGVTVAVFDFGFSGWDTLQASGDLPSGVNLVLKDFSAAYDFGPPGTPNEEHGAACAEIAYDMAPQAVMYLYAFSTEVEFYNAVDDYINNVAGNKVASMSITWVNANPYDGTGLITKKVDQAAAAGILWVNSAGNYQKRHYSWVSQQYGSDDYVQFGTSYFYMGLGPSPTNYWQIPGNTEITLFLEWNDWNSTRDGNQNNEDYDLYLYGYNGGWRRVASSIENQCGNSAIPPTEAISYTTPPGSLRSYLLVIVRYQSGGCTNNFGHWMQLFSFLDAGNNPLFWYTNPCNSITSPAEADRALGCGAMDWSTDTDPEYFSSYGPRNASGGAEPIAVVNKPDIMGMDFVSTVTYGASGFGGTSAATPHVAGLAASLWSADLTSPLSTVRQRIENDALYKGDGGVCGGAKSLTQNNRFGWGRLFLQEPLPGPTPDGNPLGVGGTAISAARSGGNITITWDVASCPYPDYHIVWYDLNSIQTSWTLLQVDCDAGNSGSWTGTPPFQNAFFMVVSDNNNTIEGSYGYDSTLTERNASVTQCSIITKDTSHSCSSGLP